MGTRDTDKEDMDDLWRKGHSTLGCGSPSDYYSDSTRGIRNMNREIKFRAWDMDLNIMMIDMNPVELSMMIPPRAVILQYTGLKDKNGKEIYEGDVVKFSGTVCDTAICAVEFHEGRFIFRLDEFSHRDIMGWRNVEVLGDIYENPELLED